jgi:hypothetical protein
VYCEYPYDATKSSKKFSNKDNGLFSKKLFLLHEEHQRPKEKMKIKGKSRHFYDIYRITQTSYIDKTIADKELHKSIVAHREQFSKLGGVDYFSLSA